MRWGQKKPPSLLFPSPPNSEPPPSLLLEFLSRFQSSKRGNNRRKSLEGRTRRWKVGNLLCCQILRSRHLEDADPLLERVFICLDRCFTCFPKPGKGKSRNDDPCFFQKSSVHGEIRISALEEKFSKIGTPPLPRRFLEQGLLLSLIWCFCRIHKSRATIHERSLRWGSFGGWRYKRRFELGRLSSLP